MRSPGSLVTSPVLGSSSPERIFRKVDFRFEFARKDFQEGGLSGAVRTDDSVAVAALEGEVYFLEENTATVLKTDIRDVEHKLFQNSDFRFMNY